MPIDTAYIRKLYEYDRWANERLLGAVDNVSGEQFTKDLGSSFSSVRDTCVHILSAERVWLSRWKGDSSHHMLEASHFPTVDSIRAGWDALIEEQSEFLAGLTNERIWAVFPTRLWTAGLSRTRSGSRWRMWSTIPPITAAR